MAVRRRGGAIYHYDFTVQGHRFRGSTESDDKEIAEAVEATKKREAILGLLTGRKPQMTLDAAFGRYVLEVAQHQASAYDVAYQSKLLVSRLGKNTLLSKISGTALTDYVAWRRASVSDSSVNREIGLLRRVLRRAANVWKVEVDMPAWGALFLPEPDAREHVLSEEDEDRLFAHLRQDYHPLFRAAIISGLRLDNLINLTWDQVDFETMVITLAVKSRKPGGKVHRVPITDDLAAILATERGKHPERVFTYVCPKNTRDRHSGKLLVKGQRYPFTRNGWRKAFYEARVAAGLPEFRFHDLRHTGGDRFYRATKNLKATQKYLGHEDIRTTMRYLRADTDDVRAGMEAASRIRHKVVGAEAEGSEKKEESAAGETSPKAGALPG